MKCPECNWNYPPELLSPMVMSSQGGMDTTAPICAICALELSNKLHGSKRTSFSGEIAESMRQAAICHRQRHPKPKEVSNAKHE